MWRRDVIPAIGSAVKCHGNLQKHNLTIQERELPVQAITNSLVTLTDCTFRVQPA